MSLQRASKGASDELLLRRCFNVRFFVPIRNSSPASAFTSDSPPLLLLQLFGLVELLRADARQRHGFQDHHRLP